jgi:putative cell wall-binding protein
MVGGQCTELRRNHQAAGGVRARRGARLRAGILLGISVPGLLATAAAPAAAATPVANQAQLREAFFGTTDSIVFTADITLTDCGIAGGALFRDRTIDLTVDGAGHTLTQTCATRIARQDGSGSLTFTDITLLGGQQAGGAGGAISSAGDVTVVGSTIHENTAALGGAIASDGAVTIAGSTLSGNTGTGVSGTGGGDGVGAIVAGGDVTITDSTVTGNSGSGGNGSNGDGGDGIGVVRAGGDVTINGSTVTGNSGTGGNGTGASIIDGGQGVGVVVTTALGANVTIADSTVTGNTGTGGAGSGTGLPAGERGVGVGRIRGPVTVERSTVSNNTGIGGAGSGTATASGRGGNGVGVFDMVTPTGEGPVAVSESTLSGNTGTGGQGTSAVSLASGGTGVGVVSATRREVTITDSVLADNSATGGNAVTGGGAGCCPGAGNGIGVVTAEVVTVTRSALLGNSGTGGSDGNAAGTGSRGGTGVGGIHATFDAEVTITASTLSANTGTGGASSNGTNGNGSGAVRTDGSRIVPDGVAVVGAVLVTNSTVTGNAGEGGGDGATGVGGLVAVTTTLVYATVVTNTGATAGNLAGTGAAENRSLASFATVVSAPAVGPSCANLGTIASVGFNASSDGSCGFGAGPGDRASLTAPLGLGALADNGGPTPTRLPAADSPLVDAIPPGACGDGDTLATTTMAADQRGLPRPAGGGCDIGAVEVQPPPPPPPPPGVVRLAGPERTATAAAISAAHFPTADTVFLATAGDFPDALTGGPLAARAPGPILLTPRSGLAAATRTELARLQPSTLAVLGGTAVLPEAVVAEAAAAAGGATVDRVAGPDRFATAAAIAARYPAASRAYLATGANFPDALTGAALAAARDDGPVLLTRRADLPSVTAAQLARLQPSELVVLGGTGVVSDEVAQEAAAAAGGATVIRLFGAERFATAAAVAAGFPAPADVVFVATGLNFPDALTGTPAAALTESPILLTRPDALPVTTAGQLGRLAPRTIVILGGETAVSAQVATELAGHLRQ